MPNRPEVPKLPRFNSIDRFLVEDAIMNVIDSKNLTKKECAESLLRIMGRSSMPLNYMLVEVLTLVTPWNHQSYIQSDNFWYKSCLGVVWRSTGATHATISGAVLWEHPYSAVSTDGRSFTPGTMNRPNTGLWLAGYQSRDPNIVLWLVDFLLRSVHGRYSFRLSSSFSTSRSLIQFFLSIYLSLPRCWPKRLRTCMNV